MAGLNFSVYGVPAEACTLRLSKGYDAIMSTKKVIEHVQMTTRRPVGFHVCRVGCAERNQLHTRPLGAATGDASGSQFERRKALYRRGVFAPPRPDRVGINGREFGQRAVRQRPQSE